MVAIESGEHLPASSQPNKRFLSLAVILGLLSFLAIFFDELTSVKLNDVFAKYSNTTANSLTTKSSSVPNDTAPRTIYGYRKPQPPYEPIRHVSHTCLINRNTSSEQIIHIPIAIPHLILIGAQKSGTSEFQLMADKCINVVTPLSVGKFEPHFFGSSSVQRSVKSEERACQSRLKYSRYFNMSMAGMNQMSVVMEKTPSYMLYGKLPQVIDAVCPWKPKILAILRNPVDRAWSNYRMTINRREVKKDHKKAFAAMIKSEVEYLISKRILDNATISFEEFEVSLANYSERMDELSSPIVIDQTMTLEDYSLRLFSLGARKGVLVRGLYAPLLLPWVEHFAADDRLMVMKFKDVMNASKIDEALRFAGLNDTSIDDHYDDFIRGRRGKVKGRRDSNTADKHHANKGREMLLDPTIRLYLQFFYQPFNRFLVPLLGREWEGWGE